MGRTFFFYSFSLLCLWMFQVGVPSSALGQADEIQLKGAYRSSINMSINRGRKIKFRVSSFDNYQKGLKNPLLYSSVFKIQSNVDYKVTISSTDFSTRNGHILASENVGVRVKKMENNRQGKNHQQRNILKVPAQIVLLGNDRELVSSQGKGNHGRGRTELNRFQLNFEIGTPAVRKKSGLAPLLKQDISPGAYSSRIILTAFANP